jgi:hypothetical protein
MKTWNIGNTTVRNPERLREALRLFRDKMSGRPFGKKQQLEFQGHMIDAGLVDSSRRGGDDGARKFASAFKQLGFVDDWSRGKVWKLTKVGETLLANPNIESTIFLRQLLKHQIPSPLEKIGTEGFNLRPFRLFLKFLKRAHDEGIIGLTKFEIGLYVITTLTENEADFELAFSRIKSFRSEYEASIGKVRKTRLADNRLRSLAAKLKLEPNTLIDYADSNSRYAMMSGLLTLKGSKIAVSESRLLFIEQVLGDGSTLLSNDDYLTVFYNPTLPQLPSDNPAFLTAETANLWAQLHSLADTIGETLVIPPVARKMDILQLQEYEQALRKELRRIREIEFYRKQRSLEALEDIESLLENIQDNNLVGGQVYAPAYFEWAIWRLFLAINHLVGSVSDTRGFRIDDDMQPIHHAKGGAADLKFTYQDFVLVCEMTLARGSQQFAMEGEPVTRHVFKVIREGSAKPVYGLFVAKDIDPNTVDAFHNARYWPDWNSAITTPVVPINIEHALELVRRMQKESITVGTLRSLLDQILKLQSDYETGPEWYRAYSNQLLTLLSKDTVTGKLDV